MYDNYPPGAANDPNAPYNQPPSAEEMFGYEVDETLNEEMDNLLDPFIEFLIDEGLAFDDDYVKTKAVTEETQKQIYAVLSNDENVRKAYIERYHDELVDQKAQSYCDDRDIEYDDYIDRYED